MSAPSSSRDFQGKRVLVVESDALMPVSFYRAMESLGADIVGPVAFPDDVSLLAGSTRLDGALVDRRIGDDERNSIHRVLRSRYVPFVEVCGRLDRISGEGVVTLCPMSSTISRCWDWRCSAAFPAVGERVDRTASGVASPTHRSKRRS